MAEITFPQEPKPGLKVSGSGGRVGAGLGAGGGVAAADTVVWLWNWTFPDYKMPEDVGIFVGALFGAIAGYLVSWLPRP